MDITRAQLDVFREDFKKFDTDSSGHLSKEQVKGMLNDQLQREATEAEVKGFFASFDADQNGVITFNEYLLNVLGAGFTVGGAAPDPADLAFDGAAPAAPAAPAAGPFSFASGLPDCCTASPDLYKTIAEIPGVARLVEMNFPPGAKDVPHEHPIHSMYFITPCKLKIADPPGSDPKEIEVPAGAAPIFPAMAHQVENAGEQDGRAIFVEPYPNCQPCGDPEGYISPFDVSPECYKILTEDDAWITGVMTMEVGAKDALHHHRDHLIFVEEGDGVTIYPGGDEESPMVVPLAPGAGIPAPMSAPPFAKHTLMNSGTVPLKMVFLDRKSVV